MSFGIRSLFCHFARERGLLLLEKHLRHLTIEFSFERRVEVDFSNKKLQNATSYAISLLYGI